MDFFKKYSQIIATLSTFAVCFYTMNEKINNGFTDLHQELSVIERELAIVKTVLIMKNVMPSELAVKGE